MLPADGPCLNTQQVARQVFVYLHPYTVLLSTLCADTALQFARLGAWLKELAKKLIYATDNWDWGP